MLDVDDFSTATAMIYDASMDMTRWPDALLAVAPIVGATAAQIGFGSGLDAISFLKVAGLDENKVAQLLPRYLALAPTDPRGDLNATRYKAAHCRQFVSDDLLRTSELYKTCLAPLGIEYSMLFTVPIERDLMCTLSVMRGPAQQPFTAQECTDFSRFAPHVGRAVTMHGAFHRCRQELATVKALLDTVPLGMMVVGGDELKVANRTARELLSEGDALRASGGQLRGATRQADADLREAISEAQSGSDRPIGLTLPIEHAEPMRAVVRRLHPASSGMLGAPNKAVALYLNDPRRPIETPEEVLQRLFGLTPREAALLRILAKGEDLQSAAAQLGIGVQTARTHLKHIMETTGTSRQAELVHLVLSSPAWTAGGYLSPS